MISWFLGIMKLIFPFFPSFCIAMSFISLIYPQYLRYEQDLAMKRQAAKLLEKIYRKKQKKRAEETILRGTKGSKDQLLSLINDYKLQKMRLQRLKKHQNHIAAHKNAEIQNKIHEIENNNRIILTAYEKKLYEYQLQIEKPYQLEEADALFLLHILNQPNLQIRHFEFNKYKDFDQEIFLLTGLEVYIYEDKR